MHIGEAGIQGDFTAAQGVGFCGGGQIVEVKLRVKGQQAVRDLGVEIGDELGYACHFGFVDVSRHQQGAGDQKRWPGPFVEKLGQCLKILKGFGVGYAAKGIMNLFAPGFQIELDQAAGFE